MKITLTRSKDMNASFCHPIGFSHCNVFSQHAISIESSSYRYFIEGEFYYSKDSRGTTFTNEHNIKEILANLINLHGIEEAHNKLEGLFVGCWIDLKNNTAGVFNDSLNQLPLYYIQEGQNITLSTHLNDLINPKTEFNQLSLYSYLLVGYAPEKETFYKNVLRMGGDTTLCFKSSGFE